jgi:hypothetical protein
MSAWDELVTTALLGTDRRPLPSSLPAAVDRLAKAQEQRPLAVLDAAAGYVGYLLAGARPGAVAELPHAPRQDLDPAPEPAQTLLDSLLGDGESALVDEWLRICVSRGLGVRPGLWARLIAAAAEPRGPDRTLVRTALGERGRAFLTTNPRWRAVAQGRSRSQAQASPPSAAALLGPVSSPTPTVVQEPLTEGGDPDEAAAMLAALPAPWDHEVAQAAMHLLGSGRLRARTGRRVAAVVGLRAPLSVRALVARLAAEVAAAGASSASAGLLEVERLLAVRADIDRTFHSTIPEEAP